MGALGSLFSKPKAPAVVMPKPVPITTEQVKAPSAEENAADLAAAEQEQRRRLAKQKGRSATILTSNRGIAGDDGMSTKKLLGG